MTSRKFPRLRPGERLRHGEIALRVPRDSDLSAIVMACQDPEIPRWTTAPTPYVESDGREFLKACDKVWREGTGVIFAITDGEKDNLIGTIGARLVEQSMGEIGYWVAPEARGRGVATAALQALSEWCFAEAGLERLQLLAEPANEASQRVAARAGYRREGLLRSYFPNKGTRRDVFIYSLLPGDVNPAHSESAAEDPSDRSGEGSGGTRPSSGRSRAHLPLRPQWEKARRWRAVWSVACRL